MKKTLITAAVAMALGFFSTPTFAKSYVVNGHAASAAEVQHLVAHGFQPGAWTVDDQRGADGVPAARISLAGMVARSAPRHCKCCTR